MLLMWLKSEGLVCISHGRKDARCGTGEFLISQLMLFPEHQLFFHC